MSFTDTIIVHTPLSVNKGKSEFSTRSLLEEDPHADVYEITLDGRLLREMYDTVDVKSFGVTLWSKENCHMEPYFYTGEIRFYTFLDEETGEKVLYSSYFVQGILKELHLIEHQLQWQSPTWSAKNYLELTLKDKNAEDSHNHAGKSLHCGDVWPPTIPE